MKENKSIAYDDSEIKRWINRHWADLERDRARPWNGRQIHNACQTAAALAAFEAVEGQKPTMTSKELDAVAEASREFDEYLRVTHGYQDDWDRAKASLDRGDDEYMRYEAATTRKGQLDRRESVPLSYRDPPSRNNHRPQPYEMDDVDERPAPARNRGGEYPSDREARTYGRRPVSMVDRDDEEDYD